MVIGRINRDLNIPHLDNDTLHARGIPKNLITSIIVNERLRRCERR